MFDAVDEKVGRAIRTTTLSLGWRALSAAAVQTIAATVLWTMSLSLGTAQAQVGSRPPAPDMEIGDEPGRVSTEEVSITDGPYARQLVFFRTSEPAGTLVIHTSEDSFTSCSGTIAPCGMASASVAKAFSGPAWFRSAERRNGLIGGLRRR